MLALEGGYTGPAVSESVLECLKTLLGEPAPPGVGVSRTELERMPSKQAIEDITKTIANHVSNPIISVQTNSKEFSQGPFLAAAIREQLMDCLLPHAVPRPPATGHYHHQEPAGLAKSM